MMSDLATKVAKTKKKKPEPVLVNLCGHQYQKRSMFNPQGTNGTEVFFGAKSTDAAHVASAVWGVRGLGLGIGCMVKIFTVDAEGKQKYLMTLYPQYSVSSNPRSTSVRVLKKPGVSFDENLSLADVQP